MSNIVHKIEVSKFASGNLQILVSVQILVRFTLSKNVRVEANGDTTQFQI